MRQNTRTLRLTALLLSGFILALAAMEPAWGKTTDDVGNAPLAGRDYPQWQHTDIMPVINHTSRVYHTWVNGNEHYYYRGDATALNDILKLFAAVKLDVREVEIRPGPAKTVTLMGKPVSYDWHLHRLTGLGVPDRLPGSRIELGAKNPTLTIFAGSGNFSLKQVQIPEGVTVIGPDQLRERYRAGLKSSDGRTRLLAADRLAELERRDSDITAEARAHRAILDEIAEFMETRRQKAELPHAKDGNFVLYISNQSFAITPVDITVHIDGKQAVKEDFDVKGQHNWIHYQFSLAPGPHSLKVVSEKGEAKLEKDFEITGKHWAVIDYWYYPELTGGAEATPRQFSFDIQDKQIWFE